MFHKTGLQNAKFTCWSKCRVPEVSSMCSTEALATVHAERKNRTLAFEQSARHAPRPEWHICEIKCLARPLNCSLESLGRKLGACRRGHDPTEAHISDSRCIRARKWYLAHTPRTKWAQARMLTSCRSVAKRGDAVVVRVLGVPASLLSAQFLSPTEPAAPGSDIAAPRHAP